MTPRATEQPMTATTGEPVAGRIQGAPARLPRAWYAAAALAPLLLLGAWGLVLLTRPAASAIPQIGDLAPNFVLTDLNGRAVSLADLRGRPVIVNFWASWCGPCVDEFPLLVDAAAAHQGSGLAVVGIVFRDRSEAAGEFMARMGAPWPAAMDPGDAVATRFGIIGPPDTFFIDRNGVIVGRQIGQLSASDLEQGLAQILGKE
jgi:cytochrome c biogenesis protein CcmG/thiol:disulfide interchange protein DsbE